MNIANLPKNSKFIGYECVVCNKKIQEEERQNIISLGCFQTWCMLCLLKKYPKDKYLLNYAISNGNDDLIIYRNNLINGI